MQTLLKYIKFIREHKHYKLAIYILQLVILCRTAIYFFAVLPFVEIHFALLVGRGLCILFAILLQVNFPHKITMLNWIYHFFFKIKRWQLTKEGAARKDALFIEIWDFIISDYILFTT
jgi:hypothetical protein